MNVTHADRVVFPDTGHTKGDVVRYYERVAERVFPHVEGRALTIRRYPKGVAAGGFFQKNVPKHYPASIERHAVPRKGGETVYPVLRDIGDLPFLANQGVIELHVPMSRVGEAPDRLVIDLDPPAGAFPLVRRAARLVGEWFDAHGLPTALVATGSKGYHVVARVSGASAEDLAGAGQKLGLLLERQHPDVFTNAFAVADREGKVFVDWMRNWPYATSVAPFSLRARARPTVATPIPWDELDATDPDAFDLDRAREADPVLALPVADSGTFIAAMAAVG